MLRQRERDYPEIFFCRLAAVAGKARIISVWIVSARWRLRRLVRLLLLLIAQELPIASSRLVRLLGGHIGAAGEGAFLGVGR